MNLYRELNWKVYRFQNKFDLCEIYIELGEKNKLKVKRKHELVNKSDIFVEIKNKDLLPGDIIYLKICKYQC